MGAGIPREIPGVLDAFANGAPARLRFDVGGAARDTINEIVFDPTDLFPDGPPALKRPRFIPIVSSHSLATMLARKSNGAVDGFVIEGPTAGGHNAPPRGRGAFNEKGEPLYTDRDVADLAEIRALGLPFWLAGGTASPEALRDARRNGAAGIQVGTLFAYADESGLDRALKGKVLDRVIFDSIEIFTDPSASPTGFPFKVVELDGTNSDESLYRKRTRKCDLGYLREAYVRPDGRTGYRCPAEPVEDYVSKGGKAEDTVGRKCLCNALLANAGHPQQRDEDVERALLTSGNDFSPVEHMLQHAGRYSAADALRYLLEDTGTVSARAL
jgi:NAD(P)H-dependent flavin oxidoreductase YrpB (nitropropane dioxygenase family)